MDKNSSLWSAFLAVIALSPCIAHADEPAGYEDIYKWAPNAYKGPKRADGTPEAVPTSFPHPQIIMAHKRSNEIRSLMVEYMGEKMRQVSIAKEVQGNEDKIHSLLKEYCIENKNPYDCADRYVKLQTTVIYKLQKGINVSEDEMAKLECTVAPGSSRCTSEAAHLAIQEEAGSKPQQASHILPYLPTYADLQDFARKKDRNLTEKDYDAWLKQLKNEDMKNQAKKDLLPAKPIREDFVKMKEIIKDDGSVVRIIDTKPDGTANIDEDEFKRALKSWEEDYYAVVPDEKNIKQSVDYLSKNKPKQKDLDKSQKEFLKKRGAGEDASYDIYARVRGVLVDAANQLSDDVSKGKFKPQKPEPRPSSSAKPFDPKNPGQAHRTVQTVEIKLKDKYTGTEQVEIPAIDKNRGGQNNSISYQRRDVKSILEDFRQKEVDFSGPKPVPANGAPSGPQSPPY